MKKIYIAIIGLSALLAGSCNKVLDETNQSGLTADPFYGTVTGMEALVNTCYVPMRFWYGKEGGASLTELGTDLFLKGGDNHHPEVATYDPVNFNSQSPLLRVYWEQFYAAVNDCNTAIVRLKESPLSAALTTQRKGEVHFLRAMYNWLIVETWGGVHLTTDETTGVVTTATRASVDQFYELIFADLDEAIKDLEGKTTPSGGRVTKPAAEAFKARMLLTRGRNAEAATLAKKVISDYNFALATDYASLWGIGQSNGATNTEVIWYINYTTDNTLNTAITTVDGNSTANAFRTEGGNQLHMMFTPRYDFHSGMLIDIPNDVGFQRYAPSKHLITLYQDADSRYEGTFKEVWKANGGPKGTYVNMVNGDTSIYWSHKALAPEFKQARTTRFEILDINDLYNSDQSLKDNRYFIEMHKHSDTGRSAIFEFRSKRDAFVMRISEMYLIVAEADLTINKPEAVTYINMLRTNRAKPGRAAEMLVGQADLNIDFILDERARELAGEQLRWFDLKRTGKLISYVKAYNPDARNNIKDYQVLRPIPQSQLDAVTNKSEFKQNPGYN